MISSVIPLSMLKLFLASSAICLDRWDRRYTLFIKQGEIQILNPNLNK